MAERLNAAGDRTLAEVVDTWCDAHGFTFWYDEIERVSAEACVAGGRIEVDVEWPW